MNKRTRMQWMRPGIMVVGAMLLLITGLPPASAQRDWSQTDWQALGKGQTSGWPAAAGRDHLHRQLSHGSMDERWP